MFDSHLLSKSAISLFADLAQRQPAALAFFLIDGRLYQQEEGWQAYENREPGCIAEYFKALFFAVQDLDNDELTPEYICCLHALCSPAALVRSAGKPGKYYQPFTGIPLIDIPNHAIALPTSSITLAGVQQHLADTVKYGRAVVGTLEINGEYLSTDNVTALTTELSNNEVITLYCPQGNQHPFYPYNIVSLLLKKFQQALETANTPDEKMRAIITHIQLLEKHHAYNDANNRTYINLLFFRCLMQQNMLPPILDNYNIFDMHSIDEIMQLVALGMERTRKLLEDGQLPYSLPSLNNSQSNALLAEKTSVFRDGMTPRLREEFARLKHRMGYLKLANEFMQQGDTLFSTVKPNEETRMMMKICGQLHQAIKDHPFGPNEASVALNPDQNTTLRTEAYASMLSNWRIKLQAYHDSFYAPRSQAQALVSFGLNQSEIALLPAEEEAHENEQKNKDCCCRIQ